MNKIYIIVIATDGIVEIESIEETTEKDGFEIFENKIINYSYKSDYNLNKPIKECYKNGAFYADGYQICVKRTQ